MCERVRKTSRLLLVATLALASAPNAAHALDRWSAPYPGVRHLHRTGNGVDLHVVLVDLTDPTVSLVATRPNEGMITTSEFARRYDAQIALNANFFHHGPCGLAVGGGEMLDRAYEHNCRASIAFGRENEATVFDSALALHGPVPAAWMTEVLSGKPFILRDGHASANWMSHHMYVPHPRTAVGLTRDRHTAVFLAGDGRRRGAPGLTGFQMLRVFQEFDVSDAVNLDGGGSTTLVVNGRVQNHPADGRENAVVSHIGIRIRPGAVWQRAEVVRRSVPSSVRQGEVAEVVLEARNMGRVTWMPDGTTTPVLEVDDGVVGYVASVAQPTAPGEVGRFAFRWQARGAGHRTLRARLRAPDGSDLASRDLAFNVEVERAPHTRAVVAQRAVSLARASEVTLPGGLGAVFVGTRGCATAPGRVRVGGWAVLAAGIALGRRARRRRMQ